MRERDAGGRIKERCDLKYSAFRELPARDYLTQGFRMPGWLGVRFGAETERAFLLPVFDLAVEEEAEKVEGYYRETAIPGRSELPARIEAIYACEDFLSAARAMEDYAEQMPKLPELYAYALLKYYVSLESLGSREKKFAERFLQSLSEQDIFLPEAKKLSGSVNLPDSLS